MCFREDLPGVVKVNSLERVDLNKEQEILDEVISVVKEILKNELGDDWSQNNKAKKFRGRLSTKPEFVDPAVNSNELYAMCRLNDDIIQALLRRGFHAGNKQSARKDGNGHGYTVLVKDGVEVIIDGAIGQFIKGHNNTFVGIREQLRQLVLSDTGDGKPYSIVHTSSHSNPVEAFERIWGSVSRDIY